MFLDPPANRVPAGFFLIVVVVLVAVISGSITDTFGELRTAADEARSEIKSRCWVCGIDHRKS